MSEAWLGSPPLRPCRVCVIGASFFWLDVERLRRLAVVSAVAMVLVALVIAVSPPLRAVSIRTSAFTWARGGEASFASTCSRPFSCRSRRACGCSRWR